MLRRIFAGVGRKLAANKGTGAGSKARRRHANQEIVSHILFLPIKAFEKMVAKKERAIPTETHLKRERNWIKISRKEIARSGHAVKCMAAITREIGFVRTLESEGTLTRQKLEKSARTIEELTASITDEALLAEKGIVNPQARAAKLKELFDAEEWNSHYTRFINDLWSKMPASLQHSLVERLER